MGQATIVSLSAASTVSWIAVDRTNPPYDEAHYLWSTLQYVHAFHRDGAGGLINAFFTVDRYQGPGYPAWVFPWMLVLGPSVQSALVSNLVLWVILLLTVAAIARLLFGMAAGITAMVVASTIPGLLIVMHLALVDVAAVTWACLAVLAMLRSEDFARWVPAMAAGVFAGAGLLTKATVLLFLVGPVVIIGSRAALRLRVMAPVRRLDIAGNMIISIAVALALAAPWYAANWDTTISYIQSATSGPLAVGAGPVNPLNPVAVAALSVRIVSYYLSFWLAFGISVAAAVLLWTRFRSATSKPMRGPRGVMRRWTWLLVLTWVLIPVGVLMTSRNQDPRQALVILPVIAIVFAGLCTTLRPRIRASLTAVVVLALLAQIGIAQLPAGSSIRDRAVVRVASLASWNLVIFGPAYPAPNPAGDEGTPVIRELEALTNGHADRVLIAQEDRVFNGTTLTWLAAVRGDSFTFGPAALTGDPTQLDDYDFAIYLPASVVSERNQDPRLQLLNERTASTIFGDQLFDIFARSRHGVSIQYGTAWILQR